MTRQLKRSSSVAHIWLMAVAAIVMCTTLGPDRIQAQANNSYDKDRILKVVRLNALSTKEIVQAIQRRGVNFQMTPDVEAEFRAANAPAEVVEALRANYRRAAAPANTSGPARPTSPASSSVPSGPPLGKNEIITLLQNGVSASRAEHLVEARGVDFQLTPEITRQIMAAGGTRSLVGAISEKSNVPSQPAAKSSGSYAETRSNTGPNYDDLTDQATAAIANSLAASDITSANYAVNLLQQALRLDPSRPTAYQLLGYLQLYGFHNIALAEQSMRAAIERGGSAVFYVYHDDGGVFASFCQGSFFISKTSVSYKASNGSHAFESEKPKIEESKLNSLMGAYLAAFHLKVRVDEGGKEKSKTFNFAPATKSKAESNLIVNLIRSY